MRGCGIMLALAGLYSCGPTPDRVVGGGSDQPNKVEAGRILTQDGQAAVGVKVVSWAGEWDPQYSNEAGKALDSSRTDTAGRWSLPVPKSSWYVTARTAGYRAVSLPGQGDARLQPEARIQGSVRANADIHVESIWIGGGSAPFKLRRLNDSSAVFTDSVLPGPARIWARIRWDGGADTVLLAERIFKAGDNQQLVLEPDSGNILIASAEAYPLRSALRGLDFDAHELDAGRWFASVDQVWGGTSVLLPANFPDQDSAIQTDAYGRYLSWSMKVGQPLSFPKTLNVQPWVGVGLRLSRRDFDWSGVKFIRVWVKGNSTVSTRIWIQLNSSVVDRIGGSGQLRAPLVLPSGWSMMNIPVQAFAPMPGTKADSLHYNWDRIKRSIRDIAFYAESPEVSLDLKEVRVIGNRLQRW